MTIDSHALTRVFDDLDPFEWMRKGDYAVRRDDYTIAVAAGSPHPLFCVWHIRPTPAFPDGKWGMVGGPLDSIGQAVKFVDTHIALSKRKALA